MFKKSLVYLLFNYIIQFVNILLNLLFMRYLNSYQMGSLTLARTWQQFVDYAHLGTRFSLDRYIPISEDDERARMVISVFIFTFASACIVFIIAAVSSHGDATVLVLTSCGIGISLTNIIKSYYRASKRIDEMLLLVFYCQLLPVLIPLVIYLINHRWGYYLFSSLVCYILALLSLLYKEFRLFSYLSTQIVYSTIKSIAASSLWLFINSIFIFLYLVMDRFFIDIYLGRDALGRYSVVTFAFTALMIIPSTCAELLFVKVIKQSCECGKILFIKEVIIVGVVTVFGIIAANFVMGYFITTYTNYGALVGEMHLATLAVIPFAFTSIYYHVMNGLDLRKQMVVVNGLLCLLLAIYYLVLRYISGVVSLDYYLYAKVATGWFIILGYIICIAYHNKKTSKLTIKT